MQHSACLTVYWPGINANIDDFFSRCLSCLINRPSQTHETMNSSTIRDSPWEKIGIDLFDHDSQNYLATVDYFSKFPHFVPVTITNAVHTTYHLMDIFSIEVPSELMSDNGPPFKSTEFADLLQPGTAHVTSSPNYTQSNEQIMRTIQVPK